MKVSDLIGIKRAFIFDLFHTLTSLETTWGDSGPFSHEMLGVSKEAWSEQLEKLSRDRLTGEKRNATAIVADMARAINPSISDQVITKVVEHRIARFAGALINLPAETVDVLRTLKAKGKRIGLISNADVMEVAAWSQCPLAGLFDSVVFSCEVGCVKPEAQIYKLSMAELGVEPGDAVFVGDGGSDELKGAQSLGVTTVMITGTIRSIWPERIPGRMCHADFVIEQLRELIHKQPR